MAKESSEMFFFNSKENNEDKQKEPDKICSERDKIKQQLKSTYVNLGFNDNEIKELFKIIDYSQNKIENLKKQLIGSNIDNDPKELQGKIIEEINQISSQMIEDLKTKTDEIKEKIRKRKELNRNY